MMNQNESMMQNAEQPLAVVKKAYQTPELTVHGRVDQITQFLLSLSGPKH